MNGKVFGKAIETLGIRLCLIPLFFGLVSLLDLQAHCDDEHSGMKISNLPVQQDTSIMIKKGTDPLMPNDFQIIGGEDDVQGDPGLGKQLGYSNWKSACTDWKKEMKELNSGTPIVALNCGTPILSADGNQYTYRSKGTYKLRVRVRDQENPGSKK